MKTVLQIFFGLLLITGWSNEAAAQDFRDTNSRALYAGFYLTMPLGPTDNRSFSKKLNYGFAAGPSFEISSPSYDPTGRPMLRAHIIDLKFSARGFERFTIAGTTVVRPGRFGGILWAGQEGEGEGDEGPAEGDDGKKRGVGSTILMVSGAIFLGLIVVYLVSSCGDKVIDKDQDKFLDGSDFCPV